MFLCEEYLLRHGIEVPLIRHVKRGSLFLKTNEKADYWRVLTINWEKVPNHPSIYRIKMLRPIYDGYLNKELFECVSYWEGHWEEYENYLLSLAKSLDNHTPIVGRRNTTMAAWEMFLFCHDGWVAEYLDYDLIYSTIDLDLNADARHQNLQEVSAYLASSHKHFFNVWKEHLLSYLENYCNWLGSLVSRDGKEIFTSQG